MTTTTAMIPPISVGDEDVGVFVGEASGGDEEDGKVIVVITDVMVVTGVGVMREDSFAQYPVDIQHVQYRHTYNTT
jgi:hypothetical protein